MKKIMLIILIFILFPNTVLANEKQKVILDKCIDGDTVKVIIKKKKVNIRMLAIDTPEINKDNKGPEPYALKAKNYTCNKLKNANNIEIEFDKESDKKDKYDRYLVWLFYDGKLLQKDLIKNGYAKVKYVYGDYKYIDELNKSEEIAKKNKKGIYSNTIEYKNDENNIKKILNKNIKKLKRDLKKFLNEILEEIL